MQAWSDFVYPPGRLSQDQRWRVAQRERLYVSLPVAIRPVPIARWLYGYHRENDPERAESYRVAFADE